ncbi:MAG TPA: hypothetical protein PKD53_34575, partial [Chloroflexaceae bacterium]|nr:hypothetical protein [Chloroflexaceae bacterium]
MALWSKGQALVLPALLLWAEALGLGADPPERRVRAFAVRLLPWAVLVTAYLAVRQAVIAPVAADEPARALLAWIAEHPLGPPRALLFLVQSSFAPSAALLYEPRL